MQRTHYEQVVEDLQASPRTWLVTGAAGFIGSHLVERLLGLGQRVVGIDNFSNGFRRNLDEVRALAGGAAERFRFVEGDIQDLDACHEVCRGADVVLHNAALGSVPRSISNPLASHGANVNGFLNVLIAARDAGVPRLVYAASSSTYGDDPNLPKVEHRIGRPLSPYAVTKYVNELYASVFQRTYGMRVVGLRYFNVFGPRQRPDGPYAAVIPRWVGMLLRDEPCVINGDGTNSRDFCYVQNVVQANLLAATAPDECTDEVYNVAVGDRTDLNELFGVIRDQLSSLRPGVAGATPQYGPSRPGDMPHSLADISKARAHLGYAPTHSVARGLAEALPWYVGHLSPEAEEAADPALTTVG
ncbi:MAG TPA: SDR family oxidoreductase [Longimicrobium sp.]|nr:SDR family oxidoreductase [Longimicrobium sp.]